jgi:MFS family permease
MNRTSPLPTAAVFVESPSGQSVEDAVFRKITWRVMPMILIAYGFAFLDRINIGYAQLQMKQDLAFSDSVYGLGAGIFFVTYLLFEVPSNLLLEKIGARLTFLRIMVLWGLASAATAFVTAPWQFYGIRLLLGIFEAGFFPGIILYLTYWYPSQRRGRVTGLFLFGMPITGVLGGPLSGTIMNGMEGFGGMHGWQWVFLVEGLPTVLLGLLLYRMLPDKPARAPWLNDAEKALVQSVLDADHRGEVKSGHHGKLAAALTDPKTYVLAFVYFCCACAVYTLTFWLPTMIKGDRLVHRRALCLRRVGRAHHQPQFGPVKGTSLARRGNPRSRCNCPGVHILPRHRGRPCHGPAVHSGVLYLRGRVALLVDSSHLPWPGRSGVRHRGDQRARNPRRLRQPDSDRLDQGCDRQHPDGSPGVDRTRHLRGPDHSARVTEERGASGHDRRHQRALIGQPQSRPSLRLHIPLRRTPA